MSALPIDRGRLAAGLKNLWVLPNTAIDIISTLQSDSYSTALLERQIRRDQALAIRILKVANSPFYGLSGQVDSIEEAGLVLGQRSLLSITSTLALAKCLVVQPMPGFDPAGFWEHSVGAALCAEALARATGRNPGAAYLGGLLHDIGRLALVAAGREQYGQALAAQVATGESLMHFEREYCGLDHVEAGLVLVERWHLGPAIRAGISGHHRADTQATDPEAALYHVADVLAHALDFRDAGNGIVPPPSSTAWNALGIGWDEMRSIFAAVEAQKEAALAPLRM